MNFTPFVITWSLLALATLGLALYRKLVSLGEDDLIHISDVETKLIPQQFAMAQKLDLVDRWGKILTIVTVASGLVIGGIYLYLVWLASLHPEG